ncbi:39S ribosomal protein L22, mitochondrial [Microsporum canis]|uniref:Mitochondrial large ribosomal subunit n=1 Tax=Arthroderma otae (strain ATCC MYA-4605 / CBS 113480) TaxID=554155 RepID=C5G0B4_ARTOC|nr:mitochondrial large ribosomal subunit [Microsporum canis CBS 113480]EEQ35567.1 mitochondrial large ribosomal subunit [Microsporum canis CBS 113480]
MVAVCSVFASRQLARSGMSLSRLCRRSMSSTACLREDISLRDSLMAANGKGAAADKQPDPSAPKVTYRPPAVKRGSLASGSIFADGDDVTFSPSGPVPKRPSPSRTASPAEPAAGAEHPTDLARRDRALVERTLIPHPNRRARWERKMVIRAVKSRGQLTKEEIIHQTERELQSRSHFFKTSLKKLGPLARQVAGKNIDEAILQMKFSKKKAAKDVKLFLEQARNEAVVSRGMGLGVKDGSEGAAGVEIRLKDGKAYTVTDETAIYIDQAWVNRGPYGTDYDHRARGQINRLRPPHTALAVVLKEDKTRIREWKDRTERALKERKSKLWVQLPDRRVSAQSQYYSW